MFEPFTLLIVILSTGITLSFDKGEPRCYSHYDWNEKVLEKTIRTELEMKEYVKSMDKALETIRVYGEQFENMKTVLDETVQDLKKNAASQATQLIQNITESKVTEGLSIPTIAFFVRTAADLSPAKNQIMKFETVLQNIGNAYDVSTGIFTAPLNGTFIFNVQFCTYSNKWSVFQIALDSKTNIILNFRNYGNPADSVFTSIAYHLLKGQQIWIQSHPRSGSTGTILVEYSDCWNQFSGTVVNN